MGLDQLELIAVTLGTARDAERLAKMRSGKLKTDPDELAALLAEDQAALAAWRLNPYG